MKDVCINCQTNKTENILKNNDNGQFLPLCSKCEEKESYNKSRFEYIKND